MKKIIIAIFSLAVLLLVTLFLAFTESGNRLILPFIDSNVNNRFENVKVNVLDLKLKPSSLYAKLKVNDTVDVNIQGPISLWNESFDLDYQADAQKIKTEEISIDKSLHVTGKAKGEGGTIHVTGSGDAFASKVTYDLNLVQDILQNLKFELEDGSISEFLVIAGQKPYANGRMSLKMEMAEDSMKNLNGKFELKSRGSAVTSVVKKELDVNLGDKFDYQVVTTGSIKNKSVNAHMKADTTMGTLTMPDMVYDLDAADLQSSYHLYLPDLGKLQPLTQRRFRGNMDFTGKVSKNKTLTITGYGKEFDGMVDYKMVDDQVFAHAKGATVSKVMYMLGYPQVLEALSEAKVNYNLTTQNGDIDASMDNARLLPSTLTKLLKQLLQIDLEKINYPTATFAAKIRQDVSNFNFNASNASSHFKINQGTYNKRTQAINAAVDILVDGKDIKGKIGGTVDHPKVDLDTSAYLKSKIGGKVDKIFDKKKGDNKVKGLLKGIF